MVKTKFKRYEKALAKIDECKPLEVKPFFIFRKNFASRMEEAKTEEELGAIKEEFMEAEKERDRIIEENKYKERKSQILEHNANIILGEEITPILREYFKPLTGKPFGEKRREAARKYFIEHYNVSVYLKADKITIVPLDENRYSCGFVIELSPYRNDQWLYNGVIDGNTIKDYSTIDFKPYYSHYIKDVDRYLHKLEKAYNKVMDKYKEVEQLIKDYSALKLDEFTPSIHGCDIDRRSIYTFYED